MSDETQNEAAKADQTYVVQTWLVPMTAEQAEAAGLENAVDNMPPCWLDIATVTVPSRTLRATVIEKALTDAKMCPRPGEQMQVRVLRADSAAVTMVGSVQPPPQLQIGS